MITEKSRPRGRPRRFDPDEAVATAQQLFHARGYDAVLHRLAQTIAAATPRPYNGTASPARSVTSVKVPFRLFR